MENQRPLCLFLFLFILFSITQATKFHVGGSQGWVPKPSESYKHWARRNKFKVNDSIVFKYKKGLDSVLEVKKEDYEKCNKKNPIKKFEEGDTVFKFDRSGLFYFISGKEGHCKMGQKLAVVVLSPRTKSPSPSPVHHGGSPAHSPGKKPPSSSPVHHGGSPSHSPGAKSPSPANSPVHQGGSPSHSPRAKSPPPSPATPLSK